MTREVENDWQRAVQAITRRISHLEIDIRSREDTGATIDLVAESYAKVDTSAVRENWEITWRATDEFYGPLVVGPDGRTKMAIFGFMLKPRLSPPNRVDESFAPELTREITSIVLAEGQRLYDLGHSVPEFRRYRPVGRKGNTFIAGAKTKGESLWWAINFDHTFEARNSACYFVGDYRGFNPGGTTREAQFDYQNKVRINYEDCDNEFGVDFRLYLNREYQLPERATTASDETGGQATEDC